jgi:hypothetical protein
VHDFVDKAVSKRARSLLLQSQEILYYKCCGQYINEHVHLNEVGLPESEGGKSPLGRLQSLLYELPKLVAYVDDTTNTSAHTK